MTSAPAPRNEGRALCVRCGGSHGARQACAAPSSAEESAAFAHQTPPFGGQAARAAPAPVRFRHAPRHATVPLVAPAAPFWPEARRRRRGVVSSTLAWSGAIVGTAVLASCLSVAGIYIAALTQADQSVPEALAAVLAALGIGLIFGVVLLYASAPAYAKVVFAALSVFLVTAGCVMLVLAPVLRQMDTPELAEYQAFSDLLWFGALSVVCGAALGLACLRWAAQREARRTLARWARLLGSAYGVLLGISGVFGVISLIFLAGSIGESDANVVERSLSGTAIAMWSFVPGVILTYQGISASMGEGSSEFRIPRPAWLLAAYGIVLSGGWWIMTRGAPVAAPMPLLHALAAALPGVALVAMAARGGVVRGAPVRWLSWRQVTLAVAISMTVGTTLALYVESLGSFCSIVLLLVHNGAFAGTQNSDDFFRVVGDSSFILTRNEQFAANLITASLLAPLIEELGKGLGVRFMLRRDTTRSQAFVLGAAAGAGFGFLEAMLYGVASVQDGGAGSWGAAMLVRGGSTSLHVVNTGLVGLAWWYAVNGRRPRFAWLLFAIAVVNHAAWNAFATALDSRILGLDTLSGHFLDVVAYVVIAVVSLAFVAAVPVIARRLRRADAGPPLSADLIAMSPWLG